MLEAACVSLGEGAALGTASYPIDFARARGASCWRRFRFYFSRRCPPSALGACSGPVRRRSSGSAPGRVTSVRRSL